MPTASSYQIEFISIMLENNNKGKESFQGISKLLRRGNYKEYNTQTVHVIFNS